MCGMMMALPNAVVETGGGLITNGTGTGQLSIASGVVKATLEQILGAAVTETQAGRIVAAFKAFFDIASPVLTMATNVATQCGTAFNTAIPGSPTADSINERIKALDDHITADYGSTEKSDIDSISTVAATTAKVDTTLEADGLNSRFTTASLVNIPVGTGGFTTVDRAKLEAIDGKLPTKPYLAGSNDSTGEVIGGQEVFIP